MEHFFRIDQRPMAHGDNDIACIVGVRNELHHVRHFLAHHRKIGVNYFIFMDNESTDGTREFICEQPDCHCFHVSGSHFAENVNPPNWTHALLNTFGLGRWCVVVDVDELLVYPRFERLRLGDLCGYLDRNNHDSMIATMIDMYANQPIAETLVAADRSLIEQMPYFDLEPGSVRTNHKNFPKQQRFGGVRERLFWHGTARREQPPCLTKVPLIKWRAGAAYAVAQHTINRARPGDVEGALLHFTLSGKLVQKIDASLAENPDIVEKGLSERKLVELGLKKKPSLSCMYEGSVRYRDSRQLVSLGWMKESDRFISFADTRARDEQAAGSPLV